MSAFCAICTDDRGPFVQRPLGRDGALVTVCHDCDEEPALAIQGPVLGVPLPPEGERIASQLMRQKLTAGNRKLRAAARRTLR